MLLRGLINGSIKKINICGKKCLRYKTSSRVFVKCLQTSHVDVRRKEYKVRGKEKARKENRQEREETESKRKKYRRERDEEEEERRDGSCRGWKRTKTAQNTQTGVLQ